jgi:hypothetical protein
VASYPTARLANLSQAVCPDCLYISKKILSRARGNFEEQNKVLGVFHKLLLKTSWLLIINIIIIQLKRSIIIKFLKKVLLEERDKKENLEVTGAPTIYCLKRILLNLLSSATYSRCQRQVGAPVINIQSTLRSASDLCKNVSLALLFGSNDNPYTICTLSGMCTYIYIYTCSSKYRDASRPKEI